jgi:hypothetical protein
VEWPIHSWNCFTPGNSMNLAGPGYSDGTTLQPYSFIICHE